MPGDQLGHGRGYSSIGAVATRCRNQFVSCLTQDLLSLHGLLVRLYETCHPHEHEKEHDARDYCDYLGVDWFTECCLDQEDGWRNE